MHSTNSLAIPYWYFAAMMSRLFGQPDTTKFSVEWVPLMEAVANYYIMEPGKIFIRGILRSKMGLQRKL